MRGLFVSEALAQVQVQRLFPLVVDAIAEIQRAQRRVQAEEDAPLLLARLATGLN